MEVSAPYYDRIGRCPICSRAWSSGDRRDGGSTALKNYARFRRARLYDQLVIRKATIMLDRSNAYYCVRYHKAMALLLNYPQGDYV